MGERMSLQWFGIKGEGLIAGLFIMGVVMHLVHIQDPIGDVFAVIAPVLLIIDIIIVLDDKARRAKRFGL